MDDVKLKVLILKTGEKPVLSEINNQLEAMQKVVGGLIECYDLNENTTLVCNEEGKVNGLPVNRKIDNEVIAGDFFIAGFNGTKIISLTDEQIQIYSKRFETPELILGYSDVKPAFRITSTDRKIPDVSQYQNFMGSQEALIHRRPFKLHEAVQVSLTPDEMSEVIMALDRTHLDLFVDSCENHLDLHDKQRGLNLNEMDFIKALQTKVCRNSVVCREDNLKTKLNFFSGREALTICHCLRQQNGSKDIENKIAQRMPEVLRKTLSPPEKKNELQPHKIANNSPIGY
jgi:hypothetical protein